ncbi:MAG: DUF3343 domain-containing protein [Clostridia bacterium]|nr:DUF3343 domain-containing protein [Clostridia bacterium]
MEYVVVAFRSRAHTVKFHGFITANGIRSEIINTPKEAGVGCGLSVKVSKSDFSTVKRAVAFASLNSFAGFFLVKIIQGKKLVRTI